MFHEICNTFYGESGFFNEIDNSMIINCSNRFLEMEKAAAESFLHQKIFQLMKEQLSFVTKSGITNNIIRRTI